LIRRSNHSYRPYSHRGHRGYRTNYRSSLGINFFFGNPGYSRYRWAPSRYHFYTPGYYSYASYRTRTTCERVLVDALHHGHEELISVEQCYNPRDGYFFIQGTERVEDCPNSDGYYREEYSY
jgi:hypothetical protein